MQTAHFDRWCSTQPPIVAMLARQIVSWPDEMADWLLALREGKAPGGLAEGVAAAGWVQLYRRHRRIRRRLTQAFLPPDGGLDAETLEDLQRALYMAQAMDPARLAEELKGLKPEDLKAAAEQSDLFTEMMAGSDEPDDASLDVALKTPEVAFFLLVWFPCWMEYGEYPPRLMRRARQGDMDALEKVLWLDKGALEDRKIAGYWRQAGLDREGARYKRLFKALHDQPKRRMDARKVKVCLAALLLKVSAWWEAKSSVLLPGSAYKCLTVPQIRDLFDAVAKDAGRGLIDTDLPESQEALYMDIYRGRDFWQLPL